MKTQKLTIKGREIGVIQVPIRPKNRNSPAIVEVIEKACKLIVENNFAEEDCQILLSFTTLNVIAGVWHSED